MSPFILGSKNDFTIRIPGVAKICTNFDAIPIKNAKNAIKNIQNFLENLIFFGDQKNLVLQLALKTTRTNSPLRFAPVANVTITGFISNVKNNKNKDTVQYIIMPEDDNSFFRPINPNQHELITNDSQSDDDNKFTN